MFLFVLLSSALSINDDLPFDDDNLDEQNGPNKRQTRKYIQPQENETDSNATNKVKRQRLPLSQLIGVREYIFAGIALIYLLFYIFGKVSIEYQQKIIRNLFRLQLSYDFAFIQSKFMKRSNHHYEFYITGRSGYIGGIVSIAFSKRCDPIGWLIDTILRKKNNLNIDLVYAPPENLHGFIRFSSQPSHSNYSIGIKEFENAGIHCYSDLEDSTAPFIELVQSYLQKHKDTVKLIEISDMYQGDLVETGTTGARFEFEFNRASQIDEDVAKFVVALSDAFLGVVSNRELMKKNKNNRVSLMRNLQ